MRRQDCSKPAAICSKSVSPRFCLAKMFVRKPRTTNNSFKCCYLDITNELSQNNKACFLMNNKQIKSKRREHDANMRTWRLDEQSLKMSDHGRLVIDQHIQVFSGLPYMISYFIMPVTHTHTHECRKAIFLFANENCFHCSTSGLG